MTPASTAARTADEVAAAARVSQEELVRDPENPVLLHRLGTLLGRLGQHDLELELIGQAIARDGGNAGYHADLGFALRTAGHPGDAELAFREALALDAGHPDAAAGLADLLLDGGDTGPARLLAGSSDRRGRGAHRALGRLAVLESRWEEATEQLIAHLGQTPTDATALFYLGVALQARELYEPAAAAYRQALALTPDLFEAHANLTTVLTALGRGPEALEPAERAVALAPDRAGTYLNRANARRECGDLAGALADLEQAVALAPGYAEAWSTLGNLHHDRGAIPAALAAHERAVALAPELAQTRWNRSFTLLAAGQLGSGWDEYEWRRRTVAARPEARSFPWPDWRGEPLAGRRLLLWREQGIGDELLFLTCLPDLVAAGADVTVLASPRLVSLLRRSFPGVRVLPDQTDPGGLGEQDFQIGVASLPRWLRRELASFPTEDPPLLRPDPAEVVKWTGRLAALPAGPRVGLCWRSGLVTPERQRHYPPLDQLLELLRTPGIVWINLQYDDCRAELEAFRRSAGTSPAVWPAENLRDDLESVTGLLASLDAVVTAPTAVSSLAGAVGRRTWQMDSGSDWTVFRGTRSPWFPAIEVVAADEPGGWAGVMEQIRTGLNGLKLSGRGAEN